MKKLFPVALLLLAFLSFSFMSKNSITENKLIATYKGLTDDDYYKFEDKAKKIILFYDISDEIEISLYEEELIGKKFEVTWIEQAIDVLDEEDDSTGEKLKIKFITALKELK